MLQRLGARIRTLREAAGLTQEALAERVGVDTQTIQRVERAKVTPSLPRVFALADALEVTMSEMFEGEDVAVDTSPVTPDELAVLRAYRSTPGSRRSLALRVIREIAQG